MLVILHVSADCEVTLQGGSFTCARGHCRIQEVSDPISPVSNNAHLKTLDRGVRAMVFAARNAGRHFAQFLQSNSIQGHVEVSIASEQLTLVLCLFSGSTVHCFSSLPNRAMKSRWFI